eukprot:scaffold90168_cov17-Tisochrysis_lutea.AAC.1
MPLSRLAKSARVACKRSHTLRAPKQSGRHRVLPLGNQKALGLKKSRKVAKGVTARLAHNTISDSFVLSDCLTKCMAEWG